jgi:hypothetical protein
VFRALAIGMGIALVVFALAGGQVFFLPLLFIPLGPCARKGLRCLDGNAKQRGAHAVRTLARKRERTILVERSAALGDVKETKTGQTRSVRLLDSLAADLREWRMKSGRPADDALVRPDPMEGSGRRRTGGTGGRGSSRQRLTQSRMPLHELVLRFADRDETRLADRVGYRIGGRIDIARRSYIVVGTYRRNGQTQASGSCSSRSNARVDGASRAGQPVRSVVPLVARRARAGRGPRPVCVRAGRSSVRVTGRRSARRSQRRRA